MEIKEKEKLNLYKRYIKYYEDYWNNWIKTQPSYREEWQFVEAENDFWISVRTIFTYYHNVDENIKDIENEIEKIDSEYNILKSSNESDKSLMDYTPKTISFYGDLSVYKKNLKIFKTLKYLIDNPTGTYQSRKEEK